MAKLDTESKMDFDRSVGTEDRFNVRNWLQRLVDVLNQSNPRIWEEVLADDLRVEGLVEKVLDRQEFISVLKDEYETGEFIMRYPELKVKGLGNSFKVSGTYESFTDGVLSFQGEVELLVVKDDDHFYLAEKKLYPRFRVQR